MNSQTVKSTVIDAQTLQQLKDEIQEELLNILNNSNLSKVLEKYSISAQNPLKLQYTLDLNQDQELNTLCMVLRKPCPKDNNPDGCWTNC